MLEFLATLVDFRRKCILERPSSFIAKVSRSYFLLLEAGEILGQSEMLEVEELISKIPEDPEELFHYLWFLNSYARYECFITKNFKSAANILDTALRCSEKLFVHTFSENKIEKQCLIFILCLNQARLSFYKEEFLISAQQLVNIKGFLAGLNPDQWKYFKDDVVLLLNTHGRRLRTEMDQDHFDYFLPKISHLENKLIKAGALTVPSM